MKTKIKAPEQIIIKLQEKAASSWWILRWIIYSLIYLLLMYAFYRHYRESKVLEQLENDRDLNAIHLREEKEEAKRNEQLLELENIQANIETLKRKDLDLKVKISERKRQYEEDKRTINRIRNWDAFWSVVNEGGNASSPSPPPDNGQTE